MISKRVKHGRIDDHAGEAGAGEAWKMHLNRREFLKLSALAALMPFLQAHGFEPIGALNVRRVKLAVGAERPFTVLHVSDSHLARIDSRDGDALHAFARARSRIGREMGEYYLCEAAHYAKAAKVKMVHTGDFMDFLSEANLEYARRFLCSYDFLACVGNHEYWRDAEHPETESYKAPAVPKLKGSWNGVPVSTHRMNGVNFFVFDNSFRTVTAEIADAFEKTLKEGLPVVMVCHVPLWTEGQGIDAFSCGNPKACDALSCEFVERARREPLVRAVLSGHLHGFHDFEFSPHARELVAGALFDGECTEVAFA